MSDLLYRACVLTTNLAPEYIAAEAFGRLNLEPTPAREALIWRAVLDGDPSICTRGGLEGPGLGECAAAADAGIRRVTDGDLTVEVVRSGSAP